MFTFTLKSNICDELTMYTFVLARPLFTCVFFVYLDMTALCCALLLEVRVMVLNATFNNIAIISWRSGLLMEETGGFFHTLFVFVCA
jgi:hypothetical protein